MNSPREVIKITKQVAENKFDITTKKIIGTNNCISRKNNLSLSNQQEEGTIMFPLLINIRLWKSEVWKQASGRS